MADPAHSFHCFSAGAMWVGMVVLVLESVAGVDFGLREVVLADVK